MSSSGNAPKPVADSFARKIVRLCASVLFVFCVSLLIPPVRDAMIGMIRSDSEAVQHLIEELLAGMPLPGMTAPENPVLLSTGLTNRAERVDWHRTAEGSDVFPVALFRALRDPATDRPLIERFGDFGFIASPDDTTGLPVGFSRVLSPRHHFVMTGLNCAGCHSTQITHQGTTLHIDGAPNLLDIEAFFRETSRAMSAIVESDDLEEKIRFVARFIYFNRVELEKLHASSDSTRLAELDRKPVHEQHGEALAFLKQKLGALKAIIDSFENQTQAGPGRADSFGIIRNLMMTEEVVGAPGNFRPMTAPVSIPHLFGFGSFTNLHWDGNTTTGNDRNYAQAIALGANFDPKTFRSSVTPYGLFALEQTAWKLQPPAWPEDVFGPLDTQRIERGAELYRSAGCAGCHRRESWHRLSVIGTDTNRIVNYNTPLDVSGGRTESYATNLFRSAIAVKEMAYEEYDVPEAERREMDVWHEGVTLEWIETLDRGYFTRPLRGVWATAPFLHNNSVPTLWDLLQTATNRPVKFPVGHREFDPTRVGFIANPAKVVWQLDTTISGNRNTGHEFGVNLSEADKWALIEYLKTL